MLPASEAPIGGSVTVGVLVESVAMGIEGWLQDWVLNRRQGQPWGAQLASIRRHVEVRDVLEIPIDAVQ